MRWPTRWTTGDSCYWIGDVLDQQIIDVSGRKVVRVNDVGLVWGPPAENSGGGDGAQAGKLTLRIFEVEVGLRGAMRRLLKGLPGIDGGRHRGTL